MLTLAEVAFLLNVDNTLLNNDRFGADLSARLDLDFGSYGDSALNCRERRHKRCKPWWQSNRL